MLLKDSEAKTQTSFSKAAAGTHGDEAKFKSLRSDSKIPGNIKETFKRKDSNKFQRRNSSSMSTMCKKYKKTSLPKKISLNKYLSVNNKSKGLNKSSVDKNSNSTPKITLRSANKNKVCNELTKKPRVTPINLQKIGNGCGVRKSLRIRIPKLDAVEKVHKSSEQNNTSIESANPVITDCVDQPTTTNKNKVCNELTKKQHLRLEPRITPITFQKIGNCCGVRKSLRIRISEIDAEEKVHRSSEQNDTSIESDNPVITDCVDQPTLAKDQVIESNTRRQSLRKRPTPVVKEDKKVDTNSDQICISNELTSSDGVARNSAKNYFTSEPSENVSEKDKDMNIIEFGSLKRNKNAKDSNVKSPKETAIKKNKPQKASPKNLTVKNPDQNLKESESNSSKDRSQKNKHHSNGAAGKSMLISPEDLSITKTAKKTKRQSTSPIKPARSRSAATIARTKMTKISDHEAQSNQTFLKSNSLQKCSNNGFQKSKKGLTIESSKTLPVEKKFSSPKDFSGQGNCNMNNSVVKLQKESTTKKSNPQKASSKNLTVKKTFNPAKNVKESGQDSPKDASQKKIHHSNNTDDKPKLNSPKSKKTAKKTKRQSISPSKPLTKNTSPTPKKVSPQKTSVGKLKSNKTLKSKTSVDKKTNVKNKKRKISLNVEIGEEIKSSKEHCATNIDGKKGDNPRKKRKAEEAGVTSSSDLEPQAKRQKLKVGDKDKNKWTKEEESLLHR